MTAPVSPVPDALGGADRLVDAPKGILRRVIRPAPLASTWTVHVEAPDGATRWIVLVDCPAKDGLPWVPAAWVDGWDRGAAPMEVCGLALGAVMLRRSMDDPGRARG